MAPPTGEREFLKRAAGAPTGRAPSTKDTVYALLKPLLFALDPEKSHELTLRLLAAIGTREAVRPWLRRAWADRVPSLPSIVMGIRFDNPLGLAAGLDKEAQAVNALSDMGFGFVELGTVTPRAQAGNPRPRLFRITGQEALINRMGFNSGGLDRFVANLRAARPATVVGVNIGKNAVTPLERAVDDYRAGFERVAALADYVAVNISSPNTVELRLLQSGAYLDPLLDTLKREQNRLAERGGRYVPIAIKIAPDIDDTAIADIAQAACRHAIDGVIATNTTVSRPGVAGLAVAGEAGGLSGHPLRALSTRVVRALHRELQGRVPIIAAGGIGDADSAWEKLVAGADLLQLYTALIFHGPRLVQRIVTGIQSRVASCGGESLSDALARARLSPAP